MLKSAIKVYARIKPIIDSNAVKHSYKIQVNKKIVLIFSLHIKLKTIVYF